MAISFYKRGNAIRRPKAAHQMTLAQFEATFPGEDACRISAKYMPVYVAEFQFRYNHRHNANIISAAIERCG